MNRAELRRAANKAAIRGGIDFLQIATAVNDGHYRRAYDNLSEVLKSGEKTLRLLGKLK